jgi:hypothetical protein
MQIIGSFFSAFIILLSVVPVVSESVYPDRPVRIIVTFALGSAISLRQKDSCSFDHLISTGEQHGRNFETECFCCPEVDV